MSQTTQENAGKWTYKDYFLKDSSLIDNGIKYWQKYVEEPRESDKAVIELVRERVTPGKKQSLLDIGCFTGNLLYHLRNAFPDMELSGGDIVPRAIEVNKENPDLAGMDFQVMDIFDLPKDKTYDFVVTNAVIGTFVDLKGALSNVADVLNSGGWYICFDWFHSFPHEIVMNETSKLYPHGVDYYFRSVNTVAPILADCGFLDVSFTPFNIGIDLQRPDPSADNALISYTEQTVNDFRLSFKGAIYQPWCFLAAQKA